MKRLLLILLALVPGIALLAWLGSRRGDDSYRWQRLTSGAEFRIRAVTFGTKHEVVDDDRTILQRAQDWWKGPRPKGGPSPFALRKASIEGPTSLYVWVESKGVPASAPWLTQTSLRLPQGEVLPFAGARRWRRPDGSEMVAVRFTGVPPRAPTLRFVTKMRGEEVVFDLPNPAIGEPLPVEEEPRPKPSPSGITFELPVTPVPVDFAGENKPAADFFIAPPK